MSIPKLVVLFLFASLISAVMVPLIRQFALKNRLLDHARSSRRKVHKVSVPRLGGIAIFLALFISSLIFARITNDARIDPEGLVSTLGIAGLVLLIGVYDDTRGLNAPRKFLAQFIAMAIFWLLGFRLEVVYLPWIGNLTIPLALSFGLTTLGLIGLINAINWIDGIDELASGTGVIAAAILAAMRFQFNDLTSTLLAVAMSGATLGFFYHNTYPARIFMGDSGALVIGFVLGALSLNHFHTASGQVFWLPVLILAVPIMDLLTTIVRRLAARHSAFKPDRLHIHHKLLEVGLTPKQASGLLHAITLLLGIVTVILLKIDVQFHLAVIALCYVLLTIGYCSLSYIHRSRLPDSVWKRKPPGEYHQ